MPSRSRLTLKRNSIIITSSYLTRFNNSSYCSLRFNVRSQSDMISTKVPSIRPANVWGSQSAGCLTGEVEVGSVRGRTGERGTGQMLNDCLIRPANVTSFRRSFRSGSKVLARRCGRPTECRGSHTKYLHVIVRRPSSTATVQMDNASIDVVVAPVTANRPRVTYHVIRPRVAHIYVIVTRRHTQASSKRVVRRYVAWIETMNKG